MREPSIKQFKLTNDEEIICEVLEWDNEETSALIVRAALRIIQGIDVEKGMRFYTFRPWMGYVTDPNELHTLNSAHIIGEVNPNKDLMKLYSGTIGKMLQWVNKPQADFNIDEMAGMDDDEIEEYIEYHLNKEHSENDNDDSDEIGNIIKFRPKGEMMH